MPEETQIKLYRDYLYVDFLKCFKRFFSIKNIESPNQHSYYSWENSKYREFMLDILTNLEPRYEERGVELIRELDEFTEVYFFNRGTYEIGFQINHK